MIGVDKPIPRSRMLKKVTLRDRPQSTWSIDLREELLTRYSEGEPVTQIAQDLGLGRTQIRGYLDSLGIKIRSQSFYAQKYGEGDKLRKCLVCNVVKDIEEFHKAPIMGGRQSRCHSCVSSYDKERRKRPGILEKSKDRELRYKYGITLDDYNRMCEAQGGLCAICVKPYEGLFVDHCHSTGKVRGLLCHYCNMGIGFFKDREDLLCAAIEYLRPHK